MCAGWLVAAVFLWRTSVPSNLDVGGLDVHRFFSSHALTRAEHYQRFANVLWALQLLANVVALGVLAWRAPRMVRTLGLGRVGAGVIVAMVVLVTLWFVSLPFGFAQQWWDARHGLAPHDYVSWIFAPWAALSFEAFFVLVAVSIVLGLAGWLGDRWWLVGGPVFVGVVAAFAFLFGYVSEVGTHGVESSRLRADVRVLERREGVTGTPVHVQDISDVTNQANAYASGFGPSANVVLWDTLLDGRFTDREIEAISAHELGHVARDHLWKGIGWFALFALPSAWLLAYLTDRRGGLDRPSVVPYAVLVVVAIQLALLPATNVVSRRYEAEADWMSLETTRDAAASASLFRKFAAEALDEPRDPAWVHVMLATHPDLADRVAMARAWAALR